MQGSSSISSADLFGRDANNSDLDLSASDLINRISFQVPFANLLSVVSRILDTELVAAAA
jgi:hypothetical protein